MGLVADTIKDIKNAFLCVIGRAESDQKEEDPSKIIKELKEKVIDLTSKLDEAKAKLFEAEYRLSETNKREKQVKPKFAVDWNGLQVVSVERLLRDGQEVTVLGYKEGDKLRESVLYCPRSTHNLLVEEFEKAVKERQGVKNEASTIPKDSNRQHIQ